MTLSHFLIADIRHGELRIETELKESEEDRMTVKIPCRNTYCVLSVLLNSVPSAIGA